MKNNTKIRLHLSKQLFEALTKEVLAESKVNDGYSVPVKKAKAPKQTAAEKAAPEVKKSNKMRTMEEMSSKEKMKKGLYKEDDMTNDSQLNELDPQTIETMYQAAGILGVGALTGLIMKLQDLLKKKNPQAYEKLQQVRGAVGAADPSKNI